ncbi:MmgE/PrpD family protein|uniref:2-methylcitrate dehydratase PrpD n=1 Tax=Dendrosporobacter quercicolus TaxID=146817 RepID=A0A1G9RV96_9FIRM|nr:MmgE/PrpD family protein [Dendrosporobacter quercicolus]NSL49331.1 MmgE/PrpD family protein [Dendrosporobacter quercicolus DSM 1736]SDM27166.1 2-methylcitrate dehydratase PrpD [Dendrosporobacter quercicolus]
MEKTISEEIAELAAGLSYGDLPEYAASHAKLLTLDVLASMVGTRNIVTSQIAREVAQELGGPAEGTIVGLDKKVALPNAAFANAIQCYGYDFVDDHNESNAHPSPATYPVGLALSEHKKMSGKRFLEAVALGNEVVCRMGAAYLGDMYYQGFHPTGTCGTMGAVVTAGKLMDLDVQQMVYAQGIAGSMVAGLMAWNSEGSFTKRLQAGHPAMNSVIAARMAHKGFNGPTDIFEGKDGLLHAYSYLDHYDAKYLLDGLGKQWVFATSSIKVYPCCRYSGGHLDACLQIVDQYQPNPEDIVKILIRSSKYTMRLLAEERKWNPKNIVDLQFSMPYQAAIAFRNGKVTVDEFDVKYIEDPLVKRLISVTEVVEDPEFERRYPEHYSSAVQIIMKDGKSFEVTVDDPKGDWRNPVKPEDVREKFRVLANRVYPDSQRTEAIIRFVDSLECQEDMSELMNLVNDAGC